MAKEKLSNTKEVVSVYTISARVHCELCKERYVTNITAVTFDPKKGEKTKYKCKACAENSIISYLIFDRKY